MVGTTGAATPPAAVAGPLGDLSPMLTDGTGNTPKIARGLAAASVAVAQDNQQLTDAMVAMETRLAAIERWANDATSCMDDHAQRLDLTKSKVVGKIREIVVKVKELDEGLTKTNRELLTVVAMVEKNDENQESSIVTNNENLKTKLEQWDICLKEQFGINQKQTEDAINTLRAELAASAVPVSAPAPPPGIGQSEVAFLQEQMANLSRSAVKTLGDFEVKLAQIHSELEHKVLQSEQSLKAELDAIRSQHDGQQQQQRQ